MPLAPETAVLYDAEYERHGTGNLFLAFAPLHGWRTVQVTERRTKPDWAYFIKDVVDVHFPDAELITLVMDNLNIHRCKPLTDLYGAEFGAEIWNRFQVHYTPTHGSWLNQAEIEIGLFARQCLGNRRIPDLKTLRRESLAWNRRMNRSRTKINWKFDRKTARRKFGYKPQSVKRSQT